MGREYEVAEYVMNEVKRAVTGKDECIRKVFAAILAGGHILLEDVPGVGKTTLAMAFSKAMALENTRVQFTPDVMPSDIVGFYMYQKETGQFTFHPGAIMCNLFLADEINRTSPKTQSALLEVMEESAVTVDGVTHPVPQPFLVIATQNPKGSAGTQLLPESQLDRFMICTSMGYPDLESEAAIAKGRSTKGGLQEVRRIINKETLIALKGFVDQVHVHDQIYLYIARLSQATRENPYIELGLSPRGTIACAKYVKAWAFLNQRSYVLPEDVAEVFHDIAAHRIVLNTKARVTHISKEAVLAEVLQQVKQPAAVHYARQEKTSFGESTDYVDSDL